MVRRLAPTNKEVYEIEESATIIGGAVRSGSAIHRNSDFERHTLDRVFHTAQPYPFHLDIYTAHSVLSAHVFKKLCKAARRKRKVLDIVESHRRVVPQAKEQNSRPQNPPVFQMP